MPLHRLSLAAMLFVLAGCARSPFDDSWVTARPLASDVPAYRPPLTPADAAVPAPVAHVEPTGELTLADVWRLALLRHPALAADGWEIRAAEARRMQADVLPNPELEFRVDDFGGSGERQSFDDADFRVRVTQLIELGDKRAKRVALARAERDLAAWDYEARRVAVAAEVTARFVNVIAMQQMVALREKAVAFSQSMHQTIEDRINAGALLPVEKNQSLARIGTAKANLNESKLELDAARRQLASTWNSEKPQFTAAAGALATPTAAVIDLDALLAHLAEHPEVARFAGEILQRQADLNLARAESVPDVKVGVGMHYLRENDEQAFLVQFEVPLPLFDRKEGAILEKRFALAKVRAEADAARTETRAALIEAHRDYAIAASRAAAIEVEVLPSLTAALETTSTQFKQGNMKLDDMLDAQRDVFKAQADHLEALADMHEAAAQLEGLIGRPLSSRPEGAAQP